MLLQFTIPKPPIILSIHDHTHTEFSSVSSFSLTFPSGFCNSSILQPIKPHKNPIFTCYTSRDRNHGAKTVDFEKKGMVKWKDLYRRLSSRDEPKKDVAHVLNQWESEGNWIAKSELSRIVKEFRKFKLYNLALEIYEWMNNRESISMTSSDSAIQLDLIAKIRGISSAEEYFMTIPDSMKDRRVYGSLLNAYVHAGRREKAESLMDIIKTRGFASNSLPYNVIMTLYMRLKEFDKVESVISEMRENDIPLDIYSYNIWLTSCGSQPSEEKMEQVLDQMKQDETVSPTWTTFSTLATLYLKFGHVERAQDYLRKVESVITGRERMAYHYLISIYGTMGKRVEVNRVWTLYKSLFLTVPNFGYYTYMSSLIRLGDIEGAETVYYEWLSVKSMYDPRIANLFLDWYVREGYNEKARVFFDKMVKVGGKPTSRSWEILAESHVNEKRISDVVYCLRNAASGDGWTKWSPKQACINSFIKLCDEEGDLESKESVLRILSENNGPEDDDATDSTRDDVDEGETENLLNQLQMNL